MRVYLGTTADELQEFLSEGTLDIAEVYAPTPIYSATHPEMDEEEVEYWKARDPIMRFETFLRRQGVEDAFFEEVKQAGDELAADTVSARYSIADSGRAL